MSSHPTKKENELLQPVELKSGLYLVATPIGNLRDVTLRALDVLNAVDVIACEDTRVSGKLLSAYGIKKKTVLYNDHTRKDKRAALLARLLEGERVALISDAGMPMISDPGYKLVRDCWEQGVHITSLPGANSPLMALQLSGLPSDCFSFIGFLPNKEAGRQRALEQWSDVAGSLIAFESAGRLLGALKDIEAVMGDRKIAIVREMTKMYEDVRQGSVSDLIASYENENPPKGEIVLVVGPKRGEDFSETALRTMLRDALKTMSTKQAAESVATQTGASKKRLYDLAVQVRE